MVAIIFAFFLIALVGWLLLAACGYRVIATTSTCFLFGFLALMFTTLFYVVVGFFIAVVDEFYGNAPMSEATAGWILLVGFLLSCLYMAGQLIEKAKPVVRPPLDKPFNPNPTRRLPPGLKRYYEQRERNKHCV